MRSTRSHGARLIQNRVLGERICGPRVQYGKCDGNLADWLLTTFEISAVTDMVALPKALTEALTSAKGSYMHSAATAGRGAISGIGRMVAGQ